MTPVFKFGDKYIFTAQIESIVWLNSQSVEIRTRTDRHLFDGPAAIALRTYLDSQSQIFG